MAQATEGMRYEAGELCHHGSLQKGRRESLKVTWRSCLKGFCALIPRLFHLSSLICCSYRTFCSFHFSPTTLQNWYHSFIHTSFIHSLMHLLSPNSGVLEPAPLALESSWSASLTCSSATSHWWLQISHSGSIYTTGIGKHYKSVGFCLFFLRVSL